MAYLLSRAARTFVPSPRSLLPNILHYSATKSYSNHARMLANRQPRSIIIHSQCLPRTSLTTRDFSSSAPVAVKRQKKYKLKTNHAAAARWKALANRMYKRVSWFIRCLLYVICLRWSTDAFSCSGERENRISMSRNHQLS
jgi:hypothetical protein